MRLDALNGYTGDSMSSFGCDMKKWFITRSHSPDDRWCVCAPMGDDANPRQLGGSFATGAEALAAFARGGDCDKEPVEAYLLTEEDKKVIAAFLWQSITTAHRLRYAPGMNS